MEEIATKMVPDDVLKKVRLPFSAPSFRRRADALLHHAVSHQVDGEPERPLAASQAYDDVDGRFHLYDLHPFDGGSSSFSDSHLPLDGQDLHLRYGTLYVSLFSISSLLDDDDEADPPSLDAAIVPNKPELIHNEPVPFRFTPNFQRFIGPHGTEGLLVSSTMAIARALTESEVRHESSVPLSRLH